MSHCQGEMAKDEILPRYWLSEKLEHHFYFKTQHIKSQRSTSAATSLEHKMTTRVLENGKCMNNEELVENFKCKFTANRNP